IICRSTKSRAMSRKAKHLARQASDLGLAVPWVVSHRLARMAFTGASPSAWDRDEFRRMRGEKTAAFAQSGAAMYWAAFRVLKKLLTRCSASGGCGGFPNLRRHPEFRTDAGRQHRRLDQRDRPDT